ncbi:cell wall protein DAN4-like, partial [Notechis scutatus]|uniref:Cell wall protein DAN4-like n=1 Tax=Notechis scutatus TaxID=8663 RepID=A0A6J1W5L8_9SAUR
SPSGFHGKGEATSHHVLLSSPAPSPLDQTGSLAEAHNSDFPIQASAEAATTKAVGGAETETTITTPEAATIRTTSSRAATARHVTRILTRAVAWLLPLLQPWALPPTPLRCRTIKDHSKVTASPTAPLPATAKGATLLPATTTGVTALTAKVTPSLLLRQPQLHQPTVSPTTTSTNSTPNNGINTIRTRVSGLRTTATTTTGATRAPRRAAQAHSDSSGKVSFSPPPQPLTPHPTGKRNSTFLTVTGIPES